MSNRNISRNSSAAASASSSERGRPSCLFAERSLVPTALHVCQQKASSSINWQARGINEKEKACQIAINVLPPSATEVHDKLAEDHRHARRSKRNKASLRDIEATAHQPGWRFCGFFEKLRRGRLLKNMIHEVLGDMVSKLRKGRRGAQCRAGWNLLVELQNQKGEGKTKFLYSSRGAADSATDRAQINFFLWAVIKLV